jgi:hypothetical protein
MADPSRSEAARRSMLQTWDIVKSGRSNLWAAIVAATTDTRDTATLTDIAWTLKNWPLELVSTGAHPQRSFCLLDDH